MPSLNDHQAAWLRELRLAIDQTYALVLATAYPEGVNQMDRYHDLLLYDAEIRDYVATFLGNDGQLDLWHTTAIGLTYGLLMAIVPTIRDDAGQVYFRWLADLARMMLQAVNLQHPWA